MGRQIVTYSLRVVAGWRHPKRAPTAFSAKNELLPLEILSLVLETVDAVTDLRIPR